MAAVFLGRDNAARWRLEANGSTVDAGVATRVTLWLPGTATTTGDEITIDTDVDDELTLVENATVVELVTGALPLKETQTVGYLTVFDVGHPNGIAWGTVSLRVKPWEPVA